MSGQPRSESEVTVCTEATDAGTVVRVVAPSRYLSLMDFTSVLEALDLVLVSYAAERDPEAGNAGAVAHLGRRKHSFRGRFLVTDADGQNLSDELLDTLVGGLQDTLHVRLSRGRCGQLQDPTASRRDSVASYSTDPGALDPDSPSFATAAQAAHLAHGHLVHGNLAHGHGGHTLSHLHPSHQQAQHHQQQQQLQQAQQNSHTASAAGSVMLSDHSASSASSLHRAQSGATSDHASGPCPQTVGPQDFTFLQHIHDPSLLDAPPVPFVDVCLAPAPPSIVATGVGGAPCEAWGGGTATTPFAAVSFHHQHTRSQPTSTSHSHSPDLLGAATATRPQRASSSNTPLAGPDTGNSLGPAGEGLDTGAGLGVARGRGPHVTFSEPPPQTAAAPAPASTTTGSASPHSSRPPSAPMPFLSSGSARSAALAGVAGGAACCSGAGAAALEDLASTLAAAARPSESAAGDDSPSSDDRDGPYAPWWSSFNEHDSVARIMSTPARHISADADLGQARSMMQRYNISALLVDTGGPAPGFITKRDFLKVQFSKTFKRTKVKDVMTQPVIYVDISLPIEQCSRVLEASGVRRVLVHDPSRATPDDPLSGFVGVVSDADLFKCMGAPALSPVVGSSTNSGEAPGTSLASGSALLQKLPTLPTLSSLPSVSTTLPGTSDSTRTLSNALSSQLQSQPRAQGQAQQAKPQQSPPQLPSQNLSSAPSTASVSNSAGPSHAPSMAMPSSSETGAAASTAMGGGGGSMIRLAAEASLADRYRCAAALWELDFNELEVTRRIGEGSFGEVLLASFRGTKVAVKRLRGFDVGPADDGNGGPGEPGPSPTQMPIFRQFFEREIEILATIRHPNVVNFIGACHTPPNVCLVTEYCARGSLDHLLHKTNIHVDTVKKVEFSMDIARGMSCLHSQKPPIIHRDLKTANLLVSARFEVKVADFGLSRIKDHAQLINSRAGLEGTVEYAAPEVLRGEPYTEKCDIWSYAVLLWEIIHRQRPYADADVPVYILMMSLGNGTLRLPPVREELATPGLARLVERCMAWHPADRPSFREVLHILEAEYKILRGKAAAVPRSDSASSMVVLPGSTAAQPLDHAHAHAHPGSKDPRGGQHHHGHHGAGHAAAAAAPAHGRHASPDGQRPGQSPVAAGCAAHKEVGSDRWGAEAGVRSSDNGASTSGAQPLTSSQQQQQHGHHHHHQDGHHHHDHHHHHHSHDHHNHHEQPPPPQQQPRQRVRLPDLHQGAPGHGHGYGAAGDAAADPISPSESGCKPPYGRTGSKGAAAHGKPGSAGRPMGRSLRQTARSKSMPLPELDFGCEEGSDENAETAESNAGEEASTAEPTPTGAAAALHAPALLRDAAAADFAQALSRPPTGQLPRSQSRGDLASAAGAQPSPGTAAASGLGQRHPSADAGMPSSARTSSWGRSPFATAAYEHRNSDDGTDVAAAPVAGTFSAAQASGEPHAEHGESSCAERMTASARQQPSPFALSAFSPFAGAADMPWSPRATEDPPRLPGRVSFETPSTRQQLQGPRLPAYSPFAGAADMPWSPRGTEETPCLPSRFSFESPSTRQQQQNGSAASPSAAAVASDAATVAASPAVRSPPRRVAFVSPFAQLAVDASSSEPESDKEADGQEREHGSLAADASICNGAPAPAATATANSTDVHVLIEKDQTSQQAQAGGCWVVLGSCSKSPSDDVHPSGGAGRPSPTATTAAASPATPVGVALEGPADAAPLAPAAGAAAPEAGDGVTAGADLSHTVLDVTARLESISLALPAVVLPFDAAATMVEAGTDSDQFDEEEEDATLHTTAWVRL